MVVVPEPHVVPVCETRDVRLHLRKQHSRYHRQSRFHAMPPFFPIKECRRPPIGSTRCAIVTTRLPLLACQHDRNRAGDTCTEVNGGASLTGRPATHHIPLFLTVSTIPHDIWSNPDTLRRTPPIAARRSITSLLRCSAAHERAAENSPSETGGIGHRKPPDGWTRPVVSTWAMACPAAPIEHRNRVRYLLS